MTSSASAIPATRSWLYHTLTKPENLVPAAFWWVLVVFQSYKAVDRPSESSVGLVVINLVALIFFVVRRDASRVGNKLECLIALCGTFVASLLTGHELRDTQLLPTIVQVLGLIGWGVSLMALGRSLAIAPADRGLVRHGPYRYVRHPIYAFEALFFFGWIMAVPTLWNAVIIAAWCALQMTRIVREERIIEGYGEYRQVVRWRILPGVW